MSSETGVLDFSTDDLRFKATERYAWGMSDWRSMRGGSYGAELVQALSNEAQLGSRKPDNDFVDWVIACQDE